MFLSYMDLYYVLYCVIDLIANCNSAKVLDVFNIQAEEEQTVGSMNLYVNVCMYVSYSAYDLL
jgi:hypothetical protein